MLIQPTHIYGIFHYFHLWPLPLKRHFTINVHSSILIHTVFAFKRIWLFNATAQSKKKFYDSREQMKLKQNGHIIPARIKQSFPLQPDWNNPLRIGRNGLVHFGLHEMAHFIQAGMKWSMTFRPEWSGPIHSIWNEMDHFILSWKKCSFCGRK